MSQVTLRFNYDKSKDPTISIQYLEKIDIFSSFVQSYQPLKKLNEMEI